MSSSEAVSPYVSPLGQNIAFKQTELPLCDHGSILIKVDCEHDVVGVPCFNHTDLQPLSLSLNQTPFVNLWVGEAILKRPTQ